MENKLELMFDYEAVELLAENGINLLDGSVKGSDITKLENILLFVWAGSLLNSPGLTREEAKTLVGGIPIRDLITNITSEMKKCLGNPEDTEVTYVEESESTPDAFEATD